MLRPWTFATWLDDARAAASNSQDRSFGYPPAAVGRAAIDLLVRLVTWGQNRIYHEIISTARPEASIVARLWRRLTDHLQAKSPVGAAWLRENSGQIVVEVLLEQEGECTDLGTCEFPCLGELAVRVVPTGKWKFEVASRPHPSATDIAVAHRCEDFGTIGAQVRLAGFGDQCFGLTCAHVLVREEFDGVGSDAFLWDHARGGWAVGAKVHDWHTLADDHVDPIDVAVFACKGAGSTTAPTLSAETIAPEPADIPIEGIPVFARGAASSVRTSTIRKQSRIRVRNILAGRSRDIQYLDVYSCDRYTTGGDSGAVVYESRTGLALGIHFASDARYSLFQPIKKVFDRLAVL